MNHLPTLRLPTTFRRAFGFIALAAMLSMTSACTAMKPVAVDDHAELAGQLSVGQKVVVETVDGERLKFTVTEIDDSGISGEEHFVAFSDIDGLRTKSLSATNTAGMVLAVNVALAAALVAVGAPAIH